MPILPTLLLVLVPTILIELVVLLLLQERRRRVLGASVIINILTNIPLNLFVLYVDGSIMTIVLGEILVIVVEALWYYLFVRVLSRAFIYSFLCNAISFLTGLLVQLLLVLSKVKEWQVTWVMKELQLLSLNSLKLIQATV